MSALHPFLRALARPRQAPHPPARFRVIYPDGRGAQFFRHGIHGPDLWVECWEGPHGWTHGDAYKLARPYPDQGRRPDGTPTRWLLAERIG